MGRLAEFRKLPAAEKWFFLQALAVLSCYRVRLYFRPIQSILKRLRDKTADGTKKHPEPRISSAQACRLIRAATTLVPYSTCLSNTLGGHILFRRCGYETKIHVGVARDAQTGFKAHAWLTLDDEVVIGHVADFEDYQELPSITGSASD